MDRARVDRMTLGRAAVIALVTGPLSTGCFATIAELRKLDARVHDLESQGGGVTPSQREQLAETTAQLEGVQRDVAELRGRVEVAEHRVEQALREAKAARADAARAGGAAVASAPQDAVDDAIPEPDVPDGGNLVGGSEEVRAYREAYAAWRADEPQVCIDRFRNFLQTYPASAYADDAAFWLADCFFKQGDYKTAILRFDDVVERYPYGNKAADALFRQGEALLRLGFGKAAEKAFERVLAEYPDSARAPEARRQLDLLSTG